MSFEQIWRTQQYDNPNAFLCRLVPAARYTYLEWALAIVSTYRLAVAGRDMALGGVWFGLLWCDAEPAQMVNSADAKLQRTIDSGHIQDQGDYRSCLDI